MTSVSFKRPLAELAPLLRMAQRFQRLMAEGAVVVVRAVHGLPGPYAGQDSAEVCVICGFLYAETADEETTTLACGHCFHSACLAGLGHCPIDRAPDVVVQLRLGGHLSLVQL